MSEVTSKPPTIQIVNDAIKLHFGEPRQPVTDATRFEEDLGCDSLDLVELMMQFEDDHNIEITDEEAHAVLTVGDAVTLLDRKLGRT